jgi:hypothetical protein
VQRKGTMMTRGLETRNPQTVKLQIVRTISMVSAQPQKRFTSRNYYQCPFDGANWADDWSCACNDRCPTCRAEIEPYFTEDVI